MAGTTVAKEEETKHPARGGPARGGYVLAVLGMVVGGGMLGAIPNTFIGALIRLLLIGLITRA